MPVHVAQVIAHEKYDMRCDVYSFGMLLWEMLHGAIPFRNQLPLQVCAQQWQMPMRRKSAARAGLH